MPETKNYTWSLSDRLGSGAQGQVYFGYNINTGEEVAIKVMKSVEKGDMDKFLSLQKKELEILENLVHPNIVKLIDAEKETPSSERKIIVMELCKGGCLSDLLQEPENKFGFDDAEFLNVLKGITAGMEELHKQKIVHRDIKPLNIMRYIGENGRTTYKLIDFGGARELEDGQEFKTLVGTEEYLQPGLYERVFFNNDSEQTFDNTVDLWSMGATLYHVATGDVPFRSYKGREDRNTLFMIYKGKESGDISGKQKTKDGKIIYAKHLPDDCLMSRGLRPAVEDLLAKLLEKDKDKISFEKFFEMANKIVRQKIVPVFDCGTTDVLKVYMDPDCSFQDFQSLLSKQSNFPPANQLLLYENLDFAEQFGCRDVVESNPVYLFHECQDINHKNLDDIKYSVPARDKKMPDLTFSKHCCESLHCFRRNVVKSQLRQRLIDSGAVMLIRFLGKKYDKFVVKLEHLASIVQVLSDKIETTLQMVRLVERMDRSINFGGKNLVEREIIEMKEKTENLQRSSTELETGHQEAVNLWTCEKPSCKEEDCCTSRIEFCLKTVEEIRSELGKNDDETRRKLKCQKLESCCNSAKTLIEDHCQKNAYELIDRFLQFLGNVWYEKKYLEKLENDLEEQFKKHALLIENINEMNKELHDHVQPILIPNISGKAELSFVWLILLAALTLSIILCFDGHIVSVFSILSYGYHFVFCSKYNFHLIGSFIILCLFEVFLPAFFLNKFFSFFIIFCYSFTVTSGLSVMLFCFSVSFPIALSFPSFVIINLNIGFVSCIVLPFILHRFYLLFLPPVSFFLYVIDRVLSFLFTILKYLLIISPIACFLYYIYVKEPWSKKLTEFV